MLTPRGFSLLALAAVTSAYAAEPRGKTHFDFRREAEAAFLRKDYAAAKAATQSALALRPDSPRYLFNLARAASLLEDPRGALATLRQLAAMGVVMPVGREPAFAPLQGAAEFRQVLQLFAENAEPKGTGEVVAELPGRTGILEGIAFRPRTGDLFLGDIHHRCIWKRDRDGKVTRFTSEDEDLFGVFGLAIDEARNTLWAATTALAEMAGYEPDLKGYAALVEFNLTTSELRRIIPVPGDGRDHGLGDVLIGTDGTIYASDSKAPVIWHLAPGAEELQKVIDSPIFTSLQGMVLSQQTLLVADYSNGLFAVDIPTGNTTALPAPKNTTLLGLDGLVPVGGGIVATQNGVEPQRVVFIGLTPTLDTVTDVKVLAAGLPSFTDLTLLTIVNDRATVIAGGGWDGFDPRTAKQPPAHTVRIFQVPLP